MVGLACTPANGTLAWCPCAFLAASCSMEDMTGQPGHWPFVVRALRGGMDVPRVRSLPLRSGARVLVPAERGLLGDAVRYQHGGAVS